MTEELIKAKELLERENYTCVFIKNGEVSTSRERGVAPLIARLDQKNDLALASCADKVVGKGAALLYALLGAKEVYATVISTPAKRTLADNGIRVFFGTEVEYIKNRAGDGFCPIESATLNINDPVLAESVIRKKLEDLRKNKR